MWPDGRAGNQRTVGVQIDDAAVMSAGKVQQEIAVDLNICLCEADVHEVMATAHADAEIATDRDVVAELQAQGVVTSTETD